MYYYVTYKFKRRLNMSKEFLFENLPDFLERKVTPDEFKTYITTSNSDKSIEDIKIVSYPLDLEKYLNDKN